MNTLITKLILVLGLWSGLFAFAGGGSSVGPGNPASYNCVKLGGQLEAYTTPQGQGANCVLDEWKLWTEMNNRGLIKPVRSETVLAYLPNPAAVNCVRIGGKLRQVETPQGTQGFCVVEEWTLFRAINITKEP